MLTGAEPGFSLGGGPGRGAKDYVPARTITSAKPDVLYSRGPGPWKLSFFYGLSFRTIWALFLSILIQNGMKKQSIKIQGGGAPPLDPPLR